jgi:SAM-dependent methyltransferase
MIFFCVACLKPSKTRKGTFGREGANCYWCNATSRDRAMLLNIHYAFFSKLLKNRGSIPKIIGVSDGHLIEKILKTIYKSHYQNYHYHQKPQLDITKIPLNLYSSADIVSCTEVLEHVAPPVDLAFSGLRKLLKKNGTLVLSVPHSDSSGVHLEHFPEMTNVQLILDEKPRLAGTLKNGKWTEFSNLIFHGGVGFTLEYRVFSFHSLREEILNSGFIEYRLNRDSRVFGIKWESWSRVWICR